jgi:carbon storage regulator CsrA
MLVLSRKEDQKVCFPELGITVEIVRVKGSTVRLGIDAPTEVRIMRDELMGGAKDALPARTRVIRFPKELRHEIRNELNSISIALHLIKREVEAGHVEDFEATFDKLVEHIERISANQALSSDETVAEESITQTHTENKHELTALLVEDQANEREMLAGLLRMHGYQVATAADGLEAIDYLDENEKPDVILIDMRMPRCDGPTTIRRIRQNPSFDGVKLFAISGCSAQETGIDVQESGVNRWFTKPLNPKLLIDAMAYIPGTGKPSACSIA